MLQAYDEASDNLNVPKQESYANKRLGKFIEEKIIKDPARKKRKASYAGDSGTVSDKVKFCEYAIETMKTLDSLSIAALAKRIYDFIETAHNK